MVYRRGRNGEIIYKRCMYRAPDCCGALNEWRRWIRKGAKCFARINDVRGQHSRGPGCCSYFQDTSSTDCALSFLFYSLPVFCLLFRHRISFQPLGLASNQKPLLVVMTFTRRV